MDRMEPFDVFIEKIVQKEKTAFHQFMAVFVLIFTLVLCLALAFFLGGIGLALCIVAVWIAYKILASFNLEYEYSVTNNYIDIDKIINQSKRVKLFSGDCKDFEMIARKDSSKYNSSYNNISQKIVAVSSMNAEDIYFILTNNDKGRLIIFFEPDNKMLESLRRFIPSKVFIN